MIALQLLPLALLVTALMLIVAYFMREHQHARHAHANKQFLRSLAVQFDEGHELAKALGERRTTIDEKLQEMRTLVAQHKEYLGEWAVREDTLGKQIASLQKWGERYPAYVFETPVDGEGEGGGHAA